MTIASVEHLERYSSRNVRYMFRLSVVLRIFSLFLVWTLVFLDTLRCVALKVSVFFFFKGCCINLTVFLGSFFYFPGYICFWIHSFLRKVFWKRHRSRMDWNSTVWNRQRSDKWCHPETIPPAPFLFGPTRPAWGKRRCIAVSHRFCDPCAVRTWVFIGIESQPTWFLMYRCCLFYFVTNLDTWSYRQNLMLRPQKHPVNPSISVDHLLGKTSQAVRT